MHRRSLEILGAARDMQEQLAATTVTPLLSDEDRRELRPILRAYAIQQAVLDRSRWWWGYDALRVVTAVAVLAATTAALLTGIGSSRMFWAALAAYVLFGAVMLLGHGVRQNRNIAPSVFMIAAIVATFATAVAAVFTARVRFSWLWNGVALGLAAAIVLLVLAEVRLLGLVAIRDVVFRPLARRRAGWLLPPQLAAVMTAYANATKPPA